MKAVSSLAVVLLASGQAWAASPSFSSYLARANAAQATANSCQDARAQLKTAADEAGYAINDRQTVSASAEGMTAVVSSIAGFEQVPASGFINGADMGFMYWDAQESEIPSGYYLLNVQANAEDIHVGEYGGTVRFMDLSGNIVASLPATIQTWSLDVPEDLPFPETTVSLMITRPPREFYRVVTTHSFRCPNGSVIIYQVVSGGYG
ncbi:hypothetical protein A176_007440 [Myxococcus hansupus]|uniref:Lipoprotein n=1 Tax=Pseudomyxococcus hansupus TaxID=1297742 RepID=A0A0H4X985_9BACT|nr:hypothetical protein [Myxococcus hansupus]AKQ70528.1 hypothetical protein A176_007440 [Myxococcus hansupus]